MIFQLLTFAFLLLFPAKCLAKEHPVPLEKNTDSATCVTCHEDRSKGKFVHSAIQMGCTACHEVRVTKDTTRVKLTTTTPTALCLTCHADKNAADLKGRVHPPAVRDCIACHDPHSSNNKFQLIKPTSGGAGENLCLSCHSIGIKVGPKGSRHAALDMGCDTCHTTHKVGDPEKHEFKYHLTKDTPALCLDCHDAKDAALQKAHNNQPFATANCVTCHNPHQSEAPKLLQAFTHVPFEGGSCDTCHKPAKDGKVVLVEQDSRKLCLTCHEDKGKEIDSAKVQHPGAAGDCIACHNPHAGKTPGFLQPDPVAACTTCHSEIAEQHKKKFPHQPAFAQGCATCHEAHGSEHQKLLRAEGNSLCLECHATTAKPAAVAGAPYVTIFSGKVRLPQDYFTKNAVPRLDIKYGLGHPIAGHPVQDVRDPSDQTKVRAQVSCLTCHQPHAGNARAMLINDAQPGLQFCRTCHKGSPGGNE
ncbi:MAG TPA: cytochrome c3 family protein [Terriglobales bacterium]|nr:cytochrome c3 family protein [Terriglobales bacterium]